MAAELAARLQLTRHVWISVIRSARCLGLGGRHACAEREGSRPSGGRGIMSQEGAQLQELD